MNIRNKTSEVHPFDDIGVVPPLGIFKNFPEGLDKGPTDQEKAEKNGPEINHHENKADDEKRPQGHAGFPGPAVDFGEGGVGFIFEQ